MPQALAAQTDVAQLLKELIQLRTVTSDQAANREALKWIKWQLGSLPLHLAEYESGGYASLVATTQPANLRPKVMLLAHIDVVPGADPQFHPRIKNGRLYGRGALDMKFAIAAYLKLLLDLGPDLRRYDLGLMITTDEEHSGGFGGGYLAALGYRPQVIINPDATSDWKIETGAKGVLHVTLTARGKAGHAAQSWDCLNAVNLLMNCLSELADDFPKEPCVDADHLHDTINIGTITGGEVTNQAPAHAEATLDIRFMPGRTAADLRAQLDAVVCRHPGLTFVITRTGLPFTVNPRHPLVRQFTDIVQEVTGVIPSATFSHGTSDSRFFAAQGVPTIASRGGDGTQHSANESIGLKDLDDFYQILRRYVDQVARI